MDCHARQVLEAISRSHYLGLTSSSLDCILESVDSPRGQAAASSLDIAKYLGPLQPHDLGDEAHVDRGLVTLIWSDSRSGLQVYLQMVCGFITVSAHHMSHELRSFRWAVPKEDSLMMLRFQRDTCYC